MTAEGTLPIGAPRPARTDRCCCRTHAPETGRCAAWRVSSSDGKASGGLSSGCRACTWRAGAAPVPLCHKPAAPRTAWCVTCSSASSYLPRLDGVGAGALLSLGGGLASRGAAPAESAAAAGLLRKAPPAAAAEWRLRPAGTVARARGGLAPASCGGRARAPASKETLDDSARLLLQCGDLVA
eukprot:scaffold164153_cov29-Tisochrysis_lutea.AAC.2